MSDRAKAFLLCLALWSAAFPWLWERIFPVHIRTESEYRTAMDELDKLALAFEEQLTSETDERRIKELADAIGRYDERKMLADPGR
jgi:hypothetical protein